VVWCLHLKILFHYSNICETHIHVQTFETEEVAQEGYFQLTISELLELSTSSADVDLGPSLPLRRFILRIGVVGQPVNNWKTAQHIIQDCASTVIIKITVLLSTVHSIRII
jgi:hypothetical protein